MKIIFILKITSRNTERIKNIVNLCKVTGNIIESNSLCRIDYLDIVNCETFDLQANLDQNSIMIVAVRIGNIRLIDNIEIK